MKVALNPVVSFKSNLIEEARRNGVLSPDFVSAPTRDDVNFPKKEPISQEEMERNLRDFHEALNDGKSIDSIIKSKHWEKTYNSLSNTVFARIPNTYDGPEYTIYSDGKVVRSTGFGRDEVVKKSDKKLAQYVEQMKMESIAKAGVFTKSNAQLSEEELQSQVADFKKALKSRKWKKVYLPASETVWVVSKKDKEALEYIISKDGTVSAVGHGVQSHQIMEPNVDMAIYYNKIATPEIEKANKPKKAGNWFTRSIANIWKFFSVTGTMSVAAVKGLFSGVITGAAFIAGAMILRAPALLKEGHKLLDIIQKPLSSAGKAGKITAGIAASLVLLGHLVAGKLQANQNTAVIDHKMKVGHRDA